MERTVSSFEETRRHELILDLVNELRNFNRFPERGPTLTKEGGNGAVVGRRLNRLIDFFVNKEHSRKIRGLAAKT